MLSVIAHLTSLAFVVWTVLYGIRRMAGRPDPHGVEFFLVVILLYATIEFFLAR